MWRSTIFIPPYPFAIKNLTVSPHQAVGNRTQRLEEPEDENSNHSDRSRHSSDQCSGSVLCLCDGWRSRSENESEVERMVKMEKIRYAPDKPENCGYCEFWNEKKRKCSLPEGQCYYRLPEKKELKTKSPCDGCSYARNAPCIGFCMLNVLADQKQKGARQ